MTSRTGKRSETRARDPQDQRRTADKRSSGSSSGLASARRTAPDWRAVGAALLLLVAAAAAHWPALYGGFIWDDEHMICENPFVAGDRGISAVWLTLDQPDYWPLTMSSHWIEWRLWHRQTHYYRLLNFLLHGLNAILVWRIGRALAIPGAWLAGLIFAVHPLAIESVDWIYQRKTLLSTACGFGSLLCAIQAHEHRVRRGSYAAAVVLLALGLLAKTAVVVLPVALMICVWWQQRRLNRRDWIFAAPFFLVSLSLGTLGVWHWQVMTNPHDIVRNDSIGSRIAIAGYATWFYLGKALLPIRLSFVYPMWRIDAALPISYLPFAAIVLLAVLFLWKRGSWGAAPLAGLGYYFVCLFPALGFVNIYFMKYSLVADHWQYLALPGVILLVVGVAADFASRRVELRKLALAVAGVACALLLVATRSHAALYGQPDNEQLWLDTMAKNPQGFMAYNNLSNLLALRGDLAGAIKYSRQAVALAPHDMTSHRSLGRALFAAGNKVEAESELRRALELNPIAAETLRSLAYVLADRGELDEAMDDYQRALQFGATNWESHAGLGYVLLRKGRLDDAKRHLTTALAANPSATHARFNLGLVLFRQGNFVDAATTFQAVIAADPNNVEAYLWLGSALETLGHGDDAIVVYRALVARGPNIPLARFRLGAALAAARQPDLAQQELQQALRLKPDYADARSKLAEVEAQLKRSR